jgi:4-hydroxy-tetrahydrodipicolinate reductase
MTNIILLGYGKMGQSIENIVRKDKHEEFSIQSIIKSDQEFQEFIQNTNLNEFISSVVIDFTSGKGCYERIVKLLEKGFKVVSGTTGWDAQKIEDIFKSPLDYSISKAAFLHSSNFSIGVNLFWKISEHSAKMISKNGEYLVRGHEIHHTQKKDAPSGTAIKTQNIISEYMPIAPFSYDRIDDVLPYHKVTFESNGDMIEISHIAKSRNVYSEGSLKAVKWIKNKSGFYTNENLFAELI